MRWTGIAILRMSSVMIMEAGTEDREMWSLTHEVPCKMTKNRSRVRLPASASLSRG